jgi:long-subunit acyl-CoA synthetase (AMP-forming)
MLTYGFLQNFVTSAQKLNRRLILDTYKKDIDAAYSKNS